jgi:phosphopantetheine--protein transferase-like protein
VTTVVGVGIDLVDVSRLGTAMERRPGFAARVFTDRERDTRASGGRAVERLAARFAAKEATMKALGVGLGAFALRDVEVLVDPDGRPSLRLHGGAVARASHLGVRSLALSLTHTGTLAAAVVVAEADE